MQQKKYFATEVYGVWKQKGVEDIQVAFRLMMKKVAHDRTERPYLSPNSIMIKGRKNWWDM